MCQTVDHYHDVDFRSVDGAPEGKSVPDLLGISECDQGFYYRRGRATPSNLLCQLRNIERKIIENGREGIRWTGLRKGEWKRN